jgi:DNA-binding NtrC family response regulator
MSAELCQSEPASPQGARLRFDPILGGRHRSAAAHVSEFLLKRREMNAILDTTPNAVCVGTRFGITRCNTAALRMLGVASLEAFRDRFGAKGEGFLLRRPNGPLPLGEAELPLGRALDGERVTEVVLAIHAGTRKEITLRVSAAPILKDGRIIGAVAIYSDISWGELSRQASAASGQASPSLEGEEACGRAMDFNFTNLDPQVPAESAPLAGPGPTRMAKESPRVEPVHSPRGPESHYRFDDVVGGSRCLENMFFRVEAVAPQDSTVLLLGETGTGKGLVARAIHRRSTRSQRPLVQVNCTALPANLIESELFGREKGAFTGASSQQIGRFEMADKGTILLDEIGDLPIELQAKLLHVIQDGEFSRLGSSRTVRVDVRIIAATNRNLQEEIRRGRFREDLFYRLNIFPITVPPLRDRREDIPLLIEFFLQKFNRKIDKQIRFVANETMRTLMAHDWPGNVRELESVIERAVIISKGQTLQVLDHFEDPILAMEREEERPLLELERDYITRALRKTHWKIEGVDGAARILGLNPSTLRGRMRKEHIHRE